MIRCLARKTCRADVGWGTGYLLTLLAKSGVFLDLLPGPVYSDRVAAGITMVKLTDLAKQLNLSRITVSAVLNDRYKAVGISEATAVRVRRAAQDMGFQRNQLALAVKTGRAYSFGFVLGSEHIQEWQAQVMRGALEAVADTEYVVKTSF
ncbi:MAG: LacI family DNA-binding transcriptional regulator, partial [Planctomycetales bacterium]|nr:LacI family DNA-binding transcriptional regulator [Planctomycetales bacterium]